MIQNVVLFSIFNAKKAIFTPNRVEMAFLYHHRILLLCFSESDFCISEILLLQWNLLDTTLVTTALEGS